MLYDVSQIISLSFIRMLNTDLTNLLPRSRRLRLIDQFKEMKKSAIKNTHKCITYRLSKVNVESVSTMFEMYIHFQIPNFKPFISNRKRGMVSY